MDCKFFKSQLLLMSNIAERCIQQIPSADWFQLLKLADEKENYRQNIIEADTGPCRERTTPELGPLWNLKNTLAAL
jgi:hypothetical protein